MRTFFFRELLLFCLFVLHCERGVVLLADPKGQFHLPVAAASVVVYSHLLMSFYSGNAFHRFVTVVLLEHQGLKGNAVSKWKQSKQIKHQQTNIHLNNLQHFNCYSCQSRLVASFSLCFRVSIFLCIDASSLGMMWCMHRLWENLNFSVILLAERKHHFWVLLFKVLNGHLFFKKKLYCKCC